MPVFTYHAGRFGTLFIEAKMIIIINEVANTTEAHIHECELSNGKDPWVVTHLMSVHPSVVRLTPLNT